MHARAHTHAHAHMPAHAHWQLVRADRTFQGGGGLTLPTLSSDERRRRVPSDAASPLPLAGVSLWGVSVVFGFAYSPVNSLFLLVGLVIIVSSK